jgi:hypothetical protein
MKSPTKLFALGSCIALMAIGLKPAARADAWNKKTIFTFDKQIQVPNKVLEPGTYVFKLADSQSDRHIVQIFNSDERHIITTILAIPNYRLRPRGHTELDFWETPAGMTPAVRAWFYPGDNFGQEFAYKPSMAVQIAAYNKKQVTTTYAKNDEVKQDTKAEETVVARNEPPPEPTPAPAAEPAPAPAPAPAPQVEEQAKVEERVQGQADRPAALPKTASYYPLITLAGLLSLGGFTIMTLAGRKRNA